YPGYTAQMGYGILNFAQTLSDAQLATADSSLKSGIKVYPNPVVTHFSLHSSEKVLSLEIYDTLGRKIQNLQDSKTYNIERLSKGVYFLKIKTDTKEYIEKIIKQ
nr:T9SS type A sorting domain-containing protein [Kaistella sp.]